MATVESKMTETLTMADGYSLSQTLVSGSTDFGVFCGGISEKKLDYNGKDISLVEVHDSLSSENEKNKKNDGLEYDKCPFAENEGIPDDNGDGNVENRNQNQNHGYAVGEFVWGKIRNLFSTHTWWPGQIFGPSDASEYAARYKREDCLLVAYFGDGSFAWCHPSQLKPFGENFEEMSKHSNSKSFVNAVEKALDEIGRLVEIEMTKDKQIGVARIVNAGIRPGVIVPNGGIGKLLNGLNEPVGLLARVRNFALGISNPNLFEVVLLRSWLNEFTRAKRGYPLAIYQEPKYIEGLEDKNGNGVSAIIDFSDAVEVPIQFSFEEDWKQYHEGKNGNGRSAIVEFSDMVEVPIQFPFEVDPKQSSSQCKSVLTSRKKGRKRNKDSGVENDDGENLGDSYVGYVRKKLKVMKSMVDNCGGGISPRMKSNLETELKVLLEKLSTMTESTSS